MAKFYVESISGKGDDSGFVMEVDSMQCYSDESRYKRITKAEYERKHESYCRKMLKKFLKPGQVVYTVLRHVSASGMQRRIDAYTVHKGRLVYLSGYAEGVTGYKRGANGQGLVMGGCGMDMGFQLVYSMGLGIWPKGTRKPHGMRNGEPDSNGGYALKHEWI